MIIEINFLKKSFWVTIIVIYLITNWVALMAFGLVGHSRSLTYDLSDTFAGLVLLAMTVGWWFAE